MKTPNELTDWFPREVPPVHPGTYDVVVREDLVTEVETTANWSNRFGRFDFWKVQTWATSTHAEALQVLRWRGRKLPRRVQLIEEPPQVLNRGRRVLLKVD